MCPDLKIAETFRALRPSALPRSILPNPSVQFPPSVRRFLSVQRHQDRGGTEARKHAEHSAPSAPPRFRVQLCPTRPFNSRYPFAASSPCRGIRIAEVRKHGNTRNIPRPPPLRASAFILRVWPPCAILTLLSANLQFTPIYRTSARISTICRG